MTTKRSRIAVGDTVQRIAKVDLFGGKHSLVPMRGIVVARPTVTHSERRRRGHATGGIADVTVRWENGYVGKVEDRWLAKVD